MNSQGLFSIGGIASGLDTTGIIEQLMKLERQPVVKMQATQAKLRKTDEAWQQINTRLAALRTAIDAVRRPDRFDAMIKVTSSNPDAVAVTKGSTNESGSLSFSVSQLATAHQVASGSFADPAAALTSAEPLRISLAGEEVLALDVDGKSLTAVAKEINAAKAGVSAQVVKVADGTHKLVLSSGKTGAASTVGVTSDVAELAAVEQISVAQDAVVKVGTMEVTRASNTITDLVPGAEIILKQVTAEPVTVTAEQDLAAATTAVKGYVDALNAAMKSLKDLSTYNAETKVAGPLQGDADARQIMNHLRTAATANPDAWGLGIQVTKEGTVTLDEAKLKAAFESDFAGAVTKLTQRMAPPPEPVSPYATSTHEAFVSATAETQAGTYNVDVLGATHAEATLEGYLSHNAQTSQLHITTGGVTITATIRAGATAAQAATDINAAISAYATANPGQDHVLNLKVAGGAGTLTFRDDRTGPDGSFTLAAGQRWQSPDLTVPLTAEGTDRTGTVDGYAGTFDGDTFTVTEGPATGLTVRVGAETDSASFAITLDPPPEATTAEGADRDGIITLMGNALARAEGFSGLVQRARRGITSQIKIYQDRIDGFDRRLATREATLRQQFTAMESAMGLMNSQMSWLQGQLGSLNAMNQQMR